MKSPIVYGLIIVVIILSIIVVKQQLAINDMNQKLSVACGSTGVVARLDLTEWVGICRDRL